MTFTEQIAEDTWWRIKWSWKYGVRLGEETLTDLLALDFVRFKPKQYELSPLHKKKEAKRGADLEIRIHAAGNHAVKLLVQAKKLYKPRPTRRHKIGRYDKLDAKAKSQMDKLDDYSRKNKFIPLYLLYNYVEGCNISRYWQCCQCQCLDKKQLGCTLVSSRSIRQVFKDSRNRKNFDWIHRSCVALPWHCLFDCTQRPSLRGQPLARRSLSLLRELFQLSDDLSMGKTTLRQSDDVQDYAGINFDPDDEQNYDWVNFDPVEGAWPEWLWERPSTTLSAEDRRQLWGDLGETVAVPRHLLLVKESE